MSSLTGKEDREKATQATLMAMEKGSTIAGNLEKAVQAKERAGAVGAQLNNLAPLKDGLSAVTSMNQAFQKIAAEQLGLTKDKAATLGEGNTLGDGLTAGT